MTTDEIGIGTTLWIWGGPPHEMPYGHPMLTYAPRVVMSVTQDTYVLDDGAVIHKRTMRTANGEQRAISAQTFDDLVWQWIHRPALLRLVERADAATLRKVAEAVGYIAE